MNGGGSLPEQMPLGEKEDQEQSHQKKQYNHQKSPRLLHGTGATHAGFARVTPMETRPAKEPLLERKCSSRGSGATVEDVNRGYPSQRSECKDPQIKLRLKLDAPT
jgi:hypothetical protein